jgi:Mor family transcriptional regulator
LQTLAPNGYNLLPGGNNRHPTEATKQKIANTLKITGFFVGKKGKAHPNFGKPQTEKQKLENSLRFSGDGSSGKKINSQIARQIYLDYLNDNTISSIYLSEKYGLKKVAILNILNKKCWKDATKDLPNVNIKNRTRGEEWMLSKITENVATAILKDHIYNSIGGTELSKKYNVSTGIVNGIIYRKTWKHIIV